MKELLQFLGAEVYVFAPDRDIDGYGISIRLIDEAISHGCRTIVTTDNGISAAEQIAYAKQNGCVVVVTDHHEVPYTEKTEEKNMYTHLQMLSSIRKDRIRFIHSGIFAERW